jgi:hypothetical protein
MVGRSVGISEKKMVKPRVRGPKRVQIGRRKNAVEKGKKGGSAESVRETMWVGLSFVKR